MLLRQAKFQPESLGIGGDDPELNCVEESASGQEDDEDAVRGEPLQTPRFPHTASQRCPTTELCVRQMDSRGSRAELSRPL